MYFNAIQTPDTFENRDVIGNNLYPRIFTSILHFKPKVGRKIRMITFAEKKTIFFFRKKGGQE